MSPPLFAPVDVTSINIQPYRDEDLGFSAIVPEDWTRVDAGVFSPYPDLRVPTLAYRFPQSINQYVSDIIINGFYQYSALPDPVDTLDINGRTWQVYQIERTVPGTYALFAFYDNPDTPYVIGIVAFTPEGRDYLRDALLIPAIQAFQPLS